jgi:hypothetical protein
VHAVSTPPPPVRVQVECFGGAHGADTLRCNHFAVAVVEEAGPVTPRT